MLYKVQTFTVEGSTKCACIIAGYRGKISSYKKVIKILNKKGYSVVAYEHNPIVITKGDPTLLPTLVHQICDDFTQRTVTYDEIICVGASIGAGLCFALQRQFPNITRGIYAGAGVSPPATIYEAPLFFISRKKFAKAGYDKTRLLQAWADVDILPGTNFASTPFIMALGKKDRIVNFEKAINTLHAWKTNGQNIQIVTKDNLGHIGIIRWYKKHFKELLDDAEKLQLDA